MEKKIIAIVCILMLMTSVFSACKQKIYMKSIGGTEYPVVTDENGELVSDKDGRIAIYVTDENGEYITDSEGDLQENYFEIATSVIVNDENVVINGFKINLLDGWTVNEKRKRLYKDDTNEKCYIEAIKVADEVESKDPDEAVSFASVVDQVLVVNQQLIDAINNGEADSEIYKKADMSIRELEDLPEGIEQNEYMEYVIYDGNDNVVHYAACIYLETSDKEIYNLTYINIDGEGYDKDFDFESWARENITISK